MENMINNIKNVVSMDVLIYMLVAIVCIIVLTILMLVIRQRKARKLLDEKELFYNTLKGVPLAFKLNKAVALSRVNEVMAESVEACRVDFDSIQDKLKECSVQLAEIDDLIYVHKTKQALKKINVLDKELKLLDVTISNVHASLDQVLEQESEQRALINQLKDQFRKIKRKIQENKVSYAQTYEYLEMQIASIEKMFSAFEEWMFASEFNKAADQQNEIRDVLQSLDALIAVLPKMYEQAKGILPRAIDEVGFHYAQAKNKGVLLEHLEVHKNLGVISDMLKNDLNKLRNGNPNGVEEDLIECEKRISQLEDQITKEEKAFDEVNENAQILFQNVQVINQDVDDIKRLYNKVYERFGFENWTQKLEDVSDKLSILNDMHRKLEKVLLEGKMPYSNILISYKELEQSAASFNIEVKEMKEKLDNACSDEERAKKQLVKLQLIVNEIQVKMLKHRLPNVSEKYEDDLRHGELMIRDIKVVLNNSPLDVNRLNADLRKAIDYIYTLYNNVNNLVGMAIMVENTIVFGNRYRSSYPEIDSELTRAELCFRNGQYTKALKIGIQCIEKMHPGAYEKMIVGVDTPVLKPEV